MPSLLTRTRSATRRFKWTVPARRDGPGSRPRQSSLHAMTIKQLRVASDDDLIEAHDEVASYHRLGWLPDEDRGAGATGRDRCSAASMSSAFGPVARRLAGQRATGNSGGRPCP